jgi:chromosomal replication initiator protein
LGRTSADGADVVDHLAEIPLPGRIAAGIATNSNGQLAAQPLPAFIAGPENRLVAATVNCLMSGGFTQRNTPHVLALFGPTGVGKTHLARGLVRHWQQQFGDDCAYYTTAADFRGELTAAIDANKVEAFRDRMRGYGLLAIDDLHRLPSNDYLAHELRSMLDAYEESGGALIVTSDRPADSLGNLPPDVRGRLASGLQLQLAAPGRAARTRIIRHASAAFGHTVSDDTANELADDIHGTASDVFGALFERWSKTATDSRTVARPAHEPAMPDIIALVARYLSVPQKTLKSASRKKSIVFARAVAIYLARELTDRSYEEIGRSLGGRDHTTIMHSYQKIDRDRLQNQGTQETLDKLRRLLHSGPRSSTFGKMPAVEKLSP